MFKGWFFFQLIAPSEKQFLYSKHHMNPELIVQQSVPGVTCNEVYQLKWLDDVFPSHFWYLVSYDSVCFPIF